MSQRVALFFKISAHERRTDARGLRALRRRPRRRTSSTRGITSSTAGPPGFLHYDDEEPARRSAEIWRDAARRAVRWTAFYALLAAGVFALDAAGCFDSVMTFTWGTVGR